MCIPLNPLAAAIVGIFIAGIPENFGINDIVPSLAFFNMLLIADMKLLIAEIAELIILLIFMLNTETRKMAKTALTNFLAGKYKK